MKYILLLDQIDKRHWISSVDMEGDMEAGMGDADLAAAGGEDPMGREQRESIDPRRLAKTLSKKK